VGVEGPPLWLLSPPSHPADPVSMLCPLLYGAHRKKPVGMSAEEAAEAVQDDVMFDDADFQNQPDRGASCHVPASPSCQAPLASRLVAPVTPPHPSSHRVP
jgi:hypothetical protein